MVVLYILGILSWVEGHVRDDLLGSTGPIEVCAINCGELLCGELGNELWRLVERSREERRWSPLSGVTGTSR